MYLGGHLTTSTTQKHCQGKGWEGMGKASERGITKLRGLLVATLASKCHLPIMPRDVETVHKEDSISEEVGGTCKSIHVKIAAVVINHHFGRLGQSTVQDVEKRAHALFVLHEGEAKRITMRAEQAEKARGSGWMTVAVLVAVVLPLLCRLTSRVSTPLRDAPAEGQSREEDKTFFRVLLLHFETHLLQGLPRGSTFKHVVWCPNWFIHPHTSLCKYKTGNHKKMIDTEFNIKYR